MQGIEKLRSIYSALPTGSKTPRGWSVSARTLLHRAMAKDSVASFTDGEAKAFAGWLEYVAALRRRQKTINGLINEITGSNGIQEG